MSDLTEFLLARIAEDEEAARDASDDGHKWLVEEETITLWPDDREDADGAMFFPRKAHAYHAATWEPERVLTECETKRRLVHGLMEFMEGDYAPWNEGFLQLLALPYADHPDYDPSWSPSETTAG